ncbi:MAG: uroporphyrinogen decarboxylase family protein [Planctomycetota bacterium]|jgi:uroporphyrinogen decarboxylase
MTPKERVICALELREPDCVPVGEFIVDPRTIKAFNKGYEDVIDFALGEGLGLVGTRAYFKTIEKLPDGCYMDEWGCIYKENAEYIAHPIKAPIKTEEDFEKHQFPDPEAPHVLADLEKFVKKADNKTVVNFHHRVTFMWSVYLMGMDDLLMAMALKPDFAHRLFKKVADINIRILQRAARAGADTILVADDYCANKGPLMSPEMFREFILPHLKRAVDVVHAEGAKCIKHCDGYVWPILEDMINAGIDCINPLEPVANMDMAEVKEKYGDRICMMGNIDCSELLCHASTTEVEEAVRECIRKGAKGGGLIVSSSNSIHSGVKLENYTAMIKAVHKYGKYPISC